MSSRSFDRRLARKHLKASFSYRAVSFLPSDGDARPDASGGGASAPAPAAVGQPNAPANSASTHRGRRPTTAPPTRASAPSQRPVPKARSSRGSEQLDEAIASLDRSVQNLRSPDMLFGQYVGATLGSVKDENKIDICIEILEVLKRAPRK